MNTHDDDVSTRDARMKSNCTWYTDRAVVHNNTWLETEAVAIIIMVHTSALFFIWFTSALSHRTSCSLIVFISSRMSLLAAEARKNKTINFICT